MREQGVPEKYVAIVKDMYEEARTVSIASQPLIMASSIA